MWKDLVLQHNFGGNSSFSIDWEFNKPCSSLQIEKVESLLDHSLPDELKCFLFETDGISSIDCDDNLDSLLFTSAKIIKVNTLMRSETYSCYMPFDHLIFFGACGNGDFFAYAIHGDKSSSSAIYLWEHETDNRIKIFENLEDYIVRFNK